MTKSVMEHSADSDHGAFWLERLWRFVMSGVMGHCVESGLGAL